MGLKKFFNNLIYRKKLLFIVLITIIVLVIGSFYAVKIYNKNNRKKETALRNQSSQLLTKYNYGAAEKKLTDLKSVSTTYADYITLAEVQQVQGKYDAAQKTLIEAKNKFGDKYAIEVDLAKNAISLNNKAQAIIYFKTALYLVNNSPDQVTNPKETINYLNSVIKQLSGGS